MLMLSVATPIPTSIAAVDVSCRHVLQAATTKKRGHANASTQGELSPPSLPGLVLTAT